MPAQITIVMLMPVVVMSLAIMWMGRTREP